MKKIIVSFIISLGLFLFASQVKASQVPFYFDTEFNDNVDAQTLADCTTGSYEWCELMKARGSAIVYLDDDQSQFDRFSFYFKNGTFIYGRGNAENTSVNAYNDYSTDLTFKLYTESSWDNVSDIDFLIGIADGTQTATTTGEPNTNFGIWLSCDIYCKLKSSEGETGTIALSKETLHQIYIEFDWTNWTARFNIDGGAWSSELEFTGGAPTTMIFYNSYNSATTDVYVDDINLNYSYENQVFLQDDLEGKVLKDFPQWSAIYSVDENTYNDLEVAWVYGYSGTTTPISEDASTVWDLKEVRTLVSERKGTDLMDGLYWVYVSLRNGETELASSSLVNFVINSTDGADWNAENGLFVYDINEACADVDPSDESLWDNFRYGIECGFNKSMYWLFHPSVYAMNSLTSSFDNLTDEFPISIFKTIFETIAEEDLTATSTVSTPFFVGEISASSTIPIVINTNQFGETYTQIYNSIEILIYVATMLYFLSWFMKQKNE